MQMLYSLESVVACIPHSLYSALFLLVIKHTHAHPILCRVVHVTSHAWPYFFNISMARICVVEQKNYFLGTKVFAHIYLQLLSRVKALNKGLKEPCFAAPAFQFKTASTPLLFTRNVFGMASPIHRVCCWSQSRSKQAIGCHEFFLSSEFRHDMVICNQPLFFDQNMSM
jgi:hypothetical protein